MAKFNITGYHDAKRGNWHVYTPEQVKDAKRIIAAAREGSSDFTLTYARELLPLVVGILFDAKRRKRRRAVSVVR